MSETPKWYTLKVRTGKEKEVKFAIEQGIEQYGWQEQYRQAIYPVQKSYRVVKGKKKSYERYMGYVFVEINLGEGDIIKDFLRSIDYVYGFLNAEGYGPKHQPAEVSLDEINEMFQTINEENVVNEQGASQRFAIGELVEVTDGILEGSQGKILELNKGGEKVVVEIKIFGNYTKTEVNESQLKKVK